MDKRTKEKSLRLSNVVFYLQVAVVIVRTIVIKGGNIRSSNDCRPELFSEATDYIDDLTNVIELLEAEK